MSPEVQRVLAMLHTLL